MNKTFLSISAGIASILFVAAAPAKADIVYDNTTHDSGYNLGFTNGWTIGNEIVLGNGLTSANLTGFSFEIYSPQTTAFSGSVQMRVYLFENNGTAFNGYASPGTTLFDSGYFSIVPPYLFTPNVLGGTVSFDLSSSPISVNSSNFTFAVQVINLSGGDYLGFEIFTNGSVGSSYGDYWANDGVNGWQLKGLTGPTSIGAQFTAAPVPEPSTIALISLGAGIAMVGIRRRK